MAAVMHRVERWTRALVILVALSAMIGVPVVLFDRMARVEARLMALERTVNDPTLIGRGAQHQQTQSMLRDLSALVESRCVDPRTPGRRVTPHTEGGTHGQR